MQGHKGRRTTKTTTKYKELTPNSSCPLCFFVNFVTCICPRKFHDPEPEPLRPRMSLVINSKTIFPLVPSVDLNLLSTRYPTTHAISPPDSKTVTSFLSVMEILLSTRKSLSF